MTKPKPTPEPIPLSPDDCKSLERIFEILTTLDRERRSLDAQRDGVLLRAALRGGRSDFLDGLWGVDLAQKRLVYQGPSDKD